jgi:creatinine amidohydrolase
MNLPNPPFPVMYDMTVKMMREYLREKRSIIIPVGVIEQHGHHLPLSTDALIATHLGRRIGEKTGILVAPTMYNSFSGGDLPGTINISPNVMSQIVSDMLVSLVSQGFRNIYFFLCHGGSENARALNMALQLLLRMNPAFKNVLMAVLPVWKCNSPGIGWRKAVQEGDWHAGWLETSLVMALEPDKVHLDNLALDEEPWLSLQIGHPDNYQHAEKIVDDELVVPRMSQRPEIRVGVMGFPERASQELGEEIAQDIVETASARIRNIEERADGVYREVSFTPEPLLLT